MTTLLRTISARQLTASIAVFGLVLAATSRLEASNVFFTPGDAFFPTGLSKDGLEKLGEGENIHWCGMPPGSQPSLCGYIGIRRLTARWTPAKIKAANAIYSEIRKYEPRQIEIHGDSSHEINSPRLFIYPKSCLDSIENMPVFLRLNETWVENQQQFGIPKAETRLVEFLPSRIDKSWKYATSFPGLSVTLGKQHEKPQLAWEGALSEEWIGLMISSQAFSEYHQGGIRKNGTPPSVYLVQDGEVKEFLLEFNGYLDAVEHPEQCSEED